MIVISEKCVHRQHNQLLDNSTSLVIFLCVDGVEYFFCRQTNCSSIFSLFLITFHSADDLHHYFPISNYTTQQHVLLGIYRSHSPWNMAVLLRLNGMECVCARARACLNKTFLWAHTKPLMNGTLSGTHTRAHIHTQTHIKVEHNRAHRWNQQVLRSHLKYMLMLTHYLASQINAIDFRFLLETHN